MPVLLLLNLYSDKVCKFYPIFFALRLAGHFLIPLDYGKYLTSYHQLKISLYFGITVFDYWKSTLAFLLPVISQ